MTNKIPFVKDTEHNLHNTHIDEILRELYPDYSYKGVFIDVGANDPVWLSNSFHFVEAGWKVISIEANRDLIPALVEHRKKDVLNYAVSDENRLVTLSVNDPQNPESTHAQNVAGYSAILEYFKPGIQCSYNYEVEGKTLNWILENLYPDIQEIDILSIDVEGAESAVLAGLDIKKYKPSVLCIETTGGRNFHKTLGPLGYVKYQTEEQLKTDTIYILK